MKSQTEKGNLCLTIRNSLEKFEAFYTRKVCRTHFYFPKMITSRFQIALPHDPSKAFGKHKVHSKHEFPKTAESAFHSSRQDSSRFQTENMPAFHPKAINPSFSEDAVNAFGKKQAVGGNDIDPAFQRRGKQDNFDDTAIHAFGKKAGKFITEPTQPFVGRDSLLNHLMSVLPEDTGGEWTTSALRKKVVKPAVMVEEEEFPVLGSKRTMEDEFPALGSAKSKTNTSSSVSFANLVKKRADEDAKEAEEKAIAEKKRQDALNKRKEELNRMKQSRVLYKDTKFRAVPSMDDVEEDESTAEKNEDDEYNEEDEQDEEETDNGHDAFDDYY